MPHRFEAKGDFVERLDGPERREAVPPMEVIERMAVSRKDVVLDLGAGIGYFSIPLSSRVKEVIAVDSEPKMLGALGARASRGRRKNIRALLGDALSLPVPDESVDRVLMAFVYHELAMPALVLEECSRVLRPKGSLTVVDFQKAETPFGPPVADRKPPSHVERRAAKRFRMSALYNEAVYYQLEFKKL